MDRSAIATAARRYIGELGAAYVGTTLMKDTINNVQSDLNEDTEYNRVTMTMSIKAGGREFTTPTAANAIYSARLGTGADAQRLNPVSRADLNRRYGDWESRVAGTPTDYYTDGPYIGFEPRATAINAWTNSTAYSVGDRVRPSTTDNGFIYDCITAGTSSGTEPTWPATIDGTVLESGSGSAEWQQSGSTRVYLKALKEPTALANGTSVPSWLPNRYHRALPRGVAIQLLEGFDAENPAVDRRIARLSAEYARDKRKLKMLSTGRGRDHISRITVQFKRRGS